MDTDALVADRVRDGREIIAQLSKDGFNFIAAFWAKLTPEDSWKLFIVSSEAIPERSGQSYRTVFDSLMRLDSKPGYESSVSISDLVLIPPLNPIAKSAITIRDRHPRSFSAIHRKGNLVGQPVEEAWIYPSAEAMSPQEIALAITNKMLDSADDSVLKITLLDGTKITGAPISLTSQSTGTLRVTFWDQSSNLKRDFDLDALKSIR